MDGKNIEKKFIRRIDFYVNLFFKSVFFTLFIGLILGIVLSLLTKTDGDVWGIGILVFYISIILGIIFFITRSTKYEKERTKNMDIAMQPNMNVTSNAISVKMFKHDRNYLIVLITYIIILVFSLLFFRTRKSEFVILLTFILLLISLIIKKK